MTNYDAKKKAKEEDKIEDRNKVIVDIQVRFVW